VKFEGSSIRPKTFPKFVTCHERSPQKFGAKRVQIGGVRLILRRESQEFIVRAHVPRPHCTCTCTRSTSYVCTYKGSIVRLHVPTLHRTCTRTKSTSYVCTYDVYNLRAHVRNTYEVAMAVCGNNEAIDELDDFSRRMLIDNEKIILKLGFLFLFFPLLFLSWIPVWSKMSEI